MESSAAVRRQAHRLLVYMFLFVAGRLVGSGRGKGGDVTQKQKKNM